MKKNAGSSQLPLHFLPESLIGIPRQVEMADACILFHSFHKGSIRLLPVSYTHLDVYKRQNQKGVGIILWASWRNSANDTEAAFSHYAQMGIKGFKIDTFGSMVDGKMGNNSFDAGIALGLTFEYRRFIIGAETQRCV